MDYLEYIKEAGPFTTPLCIGAYFVVKWLLKDRERLLKLLAEAEADRRELREKRADDLEKATIEYREFGEASRNVIRDFLLKAESWTRPEK